MILINVVIFHDQLMKQVIDYIDDIGVHLIKHINIDINDQNQVLIFFSNTSLIIIETLPTSI